MGKDNELLRLWYGGLGDMYREYRKERSWIGLSLMRYDDDPKKRMHYHMIHALMLLGLTVVFLAIELALLYFLSGTAMLWLPALPLIAVFVTSTMIIRTLFYSYRLYDALKYERDTDTNDVMRMDSIMKAIKWGKKQGILHETVKGYYRMVNQQDD